MANKAKKLAKNRPTFVRYWSELHIVANKLRRWRKEHPKATTADVRERERELRSRYVDTRKK